MPISSTSQHDKQSERHTSFGDVKGDLAHVKEDVTQLANDATKIAKDGMNMTMDSARKVADQVQTGHQKICAYTSEHPTAALLIAVGIGAIAGRLMARWF